MNNTRSPLSWSRAYVLVAVLWILLVPVLAFMTNVLLENFFKNLLFSGLEDSYPLLTAGYQALGTSGLYGIFGGLGAVIFLLFPLRKRLIVVVLAVIILLSSVYFAMFGMIAAYIGYVKLCVQ